MQEENIWQAGSGKGWNQRNARRKASGRKIVNAPSQKQDGKAEWLRSQHNRITVSFWTVYTEFREGEG